ncbi:MAG: hypothetical protein ABSH09_03080 [Bryobacteraceae bacterium]
MTRRQFQIEESGGFYKRGQPDTIGTGYKAYFCSFGVSLAIGACVETRPDNGFALLRRDEGGKQAPIENCWNVSSCAQFHGCTTVAFSRSGRGYSGSLTNGRFATSLEGR